MIILKVPEGNKCSGCMFLEIDYMHNIPECKLFNDRQDHRMEYGDIDKESIEKLNNCPNDQA